jgi:hypothetical protein
MFFALNEIWLAAYAVTLASRWFGPSETGRIPLTGLVERLRY